MSATTARPSVAVGTTAREGHRLEWSGTSGSSNKHNGYLAKLTPDGQILRRGSFGGYSCQVVGDPYGDEAYGMVADSSGGVWVVGWTSCDDFPIANAHQPTRAGNRDDSSCIFPITPTIDLFHVLGGA
jgi:hypothetical protein